MKKEFSWVSTLILILLVGCSYVPGGTPPRNLVPTSTLSPEQMQTQINLMLTQLPTSTGQAEQASATPQLPTLVATATTGSPTQAATATVTTIPTAAATAAPAAATATQVSATATAGATATAAATTAPAAATATATVVPTQSGPTFTPVPGDPRTRLGNPTSTDPMDNSTKWIWPTGFDKYTSATFSNGVQSITALTTTDGWRLANPTGQPFSNVYLEATFNTGACTGSDHYGLLTRVPILTQPTQGYLFTFTCDGKFSVRRWDAEIGPKGEMKRIVDWKASSAIISGANKVNRMGVMTVGSRLMLYANGQLIADVQDTVFPSGYFGVMLGSVNTTNYTIQLDDMSYWLNPQP